MKKSIRFSSLFLTVSWLVFTTLQLGAQEGTSTLEFSLNMQLPLEEGWLEPGSGKVGIRGDVKPLSWDRTLPASDGDGDGIYEVEVPFPFSEDSLALSYKIKVDGVDHPNDGWQPGPNHRITIKKNQQQTITLSWEDEAGTPPPRHSGNVQVIRDFKSGPLGERDIHIYLPPGYEESKERYPVLYMHDGQFLFDADYAGEEMGMDEWAEELIRSGKIGPLIIVGIGNTSNRTDEYTPSRQMWYHELSRVSPPTGGQLNHLTGTFAAKEGETIHFKASNDTLLAMIPGSDHWQALVPGANSAYYLPGADITFSFSTRGENVVEEVTASKPPMGGKGDLYGKFIVNTLKPRIDSELRTLPGPEHTGLAGASFGGLITMHLGMNYPEVFGPLYLLSPSVWWDQRILLKEVEELTGPTPQPVWLYIGTGEGQEFVRNTRSLRDALLGKRWDPESVTYVESTGARHNLDAWSEQAEAILLDYDSRLKE
jgi:predicted alpha/beta superfamily hydrolase